MQKMVKTGFRDKRKRNPLPVHILSYSETSPKERKNVVMENQKKPPPSPLQRGNVETERRRDN